MTKRVVKENSEKSSKPSVANLAALGCVRFF